MNIHIHSYFLICLTFIFLIQTQGNENSALSLKNPSIHTNIYYKCGNIFVNQSRQNGITYLDKIWHIGRLLSGITNRILFIAGKCSFEMVFDIHAGRAASGS